MFWNNGSSQAVVRYSTEESYISFPWFPPRWPLAKGQHHSKETDTETTHQLYTDFTSFSYTHWERGVCIYLVLCDLIMCSLFDKTEMRLAGEPYTNESSFLQTLPFMVQRMSLDTVSRMCSWITRFRRQTWRQEQSLLSPKSQPQLSTWTLLAQPWNNK